MAEKQRASSLLFEPHDLLVALSMATRLPVPVDHRRASARIAAAAWAAPLVGALIGLVGACVFWGLGVLGAGAMVAAWFAIGAQLLITGAMHEDGLADSADGLGVGGGPARITEIMRDSRVGAFGVAALIVALGAKAAAIGGAADVFAAMIAAGALSRALMVAFWAGLHAAPGEGGLAAQAGRPELFHAAAALAIGGLLAALLSFSWALLFGLLLAVLTAGGFTYYALRRLGRLSGDVLGAALVIAEVSLLAMLAGV